MTQELNKCNFLYILHFSNKKETIKLTFKNKKTYVKRLVTFIHIYIPNNYIIILHNDSWQLPKDFYIHIM